MSYKDNPKEWFKNEIEEYGEIIGERELICPYCFNEQIDKFEIDGNYDEGEHEYECLFCKKKFIFERVIDVTYNITRMEDKE